MAKTESLHVSNLPYRTTDDDLAASFDGCVRAKVITDPNTGRSRGFGFVHFESSEAAEAMMEKLNGEIEIDGRTCKVNPANPPRSDGDRRGGYGSSRGSFGGRGRGGSGGSGRYSGNYSRDGNSSYSRDGSSGGGYGGYRRNTGGSGSGSYTATGYGYASGGDQ